MGMDAAALFAGMTLFAGTVLFLTISGKLLESKNKQILTQTVADQGTKRKYEALEKYGKDLTAMAKAGKLDPVTGRCDKINNCFKFLYMINNNNPLLIGEPGVGKTAIAHGIAQRIVQGSAPYHFLNRKLISLDMGALIDGTKYEGEFEDRLNAVLKEVTESDGQTILSIDDIHTIFGAGSTNSAMYAGNLLMLMLGRGELQCIGATTLDDYKIYIEKHPSLKDRFQQVYVDQPTVEETISILRLRVMHQRYELHHGVRIFDDALVEAADLSDRYISGRFLPDKAIDLVDEAIAKLEIKQAKHDYDLHRAAELKYRSLNSLQCQLENTKKELNESMSSGKSMLREVTRNDIAEIVSKRTGIPVPKLQQSEREKLLHLKEELNKRVVGQDLAVREVVEVIQVSLLGLSEPNRPVGSYMSLGPTAVGKTELAKALASYLFDTEEALMRIDMSEYMEKHAVFRLIGIPHGYEGYEEGGLLTERVRRRPYTVILFDKIEKAHSDVFNVLLQILDNGRVNQLIGSNCEFHEHYHHYDFKCGFRAHTQYI